MEAPVAIYASSNTADPNLPPQLGFIAGLACRLSGSVFPFDAQTLDELYPNHDAYVSQVSASVNALKAAGLMLQSDAKATKEAAAKSEIGE
jgi:hypothetical protein